MASKFLISSSKLLCRSELQGGHFITFDKDSKLLMFVARGVLALMMHKCDTSCGLFPTFCIKP